MKILFLSLILVATNIKQSGAREVTNEDIRDAMISLVHMFRTSEDKLERHEFREKALGDQLKKALANLDKKHKSLEPLKGAISRLDERLSNVETILLKKDEREKQQVQKTSEMVDALQMSLNTWSTNIMNMVQNEIRGIKMPTIDTNSTDNKLKSLEDTIKKKFDDVIGATKALNEVVISLKDQKINDNCNNPHQSEELFIKHIDETEKLLTKYDSKLMEYQVNMTKINSEPDPYGEILAADEAWHNKMTIVLEKQQDNLEKIHQSLQNVEEVLKDMPKKYNDIERLSNDSMKAIQESNQNIMQSTEIRVMKLIEKIKNIMQKTEDSLETVKQDIFSAETKTENMYTEVINKYEQLRTEVQSLAKGERVMIQTADNVLDTKRRIEYGIHQILSEVGNLIKTQGDDLNSTLNQRFDDIEISIVDNQNGALGNLSTKIEHEMSQVWRQIGIMYQQITAGNTALDRLQAQTEQYVNGSITTMDSMEGKVGLVTNRMVNVDENLNFLLGKLSLITQEFNQIKIGLGDALDSIKSNFLSVQSKLKDAGPGPHNIADDKKTT